MKKNHRIVLYYFLALGSILLGLILFRIFEDTPYVAYPAIIIGLILCFVFAFLIDREQKKRRLDEREADTKKMLAQDPSVCVLEPVVKNAKSILNPNVNFNDERNLKRLKNSEFFFTAYRKDADVELVRRYHMEDEGENEPTLSEEQYEQVEKWELGFYFITSSELVLLKSRTFLVTQDVYQALRSINFFYHFMKDNEFLVGDAA